MVHFSLYISFMSDFTRNQSLAPGNGKEYRINGTQVITDWRNLRIPAPENMQDNIGGVNELTRVVKEQKEIRHLTSSNFA